MSSCGALQVPEGFKRSFKDPGMTTYRLHIQLLCGKCLIVMNNLLLPCLEGSLAVSLNVFHKLLWFTALQCSETFAAERCCCYSATKSSCNISLKICDLSCCFGGLTDLGKHSIWNRVKKEVLFLQCNWKAAVKMLLPQFLCIFSFIPTSGHRGSQWKPFDWFAGFLGWCSVQNPLYLLGGGR